MSGKRNWGDNMTDRRDGKTPPPLIERGFKVPSRLWKKKYKCKKNKGDHTPVIDRLVNKHWWNLRDGFWRIGGFRWGTVPYWVEWRCTACRKLLVEYNAPEKKFDRYRHES